MKAQIHAGGRGKGGGVKLASSPAEAEKLAHQIIGMNLVTHQTGPEGRTVRRVLIEEGMRIKKEYYLGIVIDRASQRPVFMTSTEGGMDIEKVAAETPHLIHKEYIDPTVGFQAFQRPSPGIRFGSDRRIARPGRQVHDCALPGL